MIERDPAKRLQLVRETLLTLNEQLDIARLNRDAVRGRSIVLDIKRLQEELRKLEDGESETI